MVLTDCMNNFSELDAMRSTILFRVMPLLLVITVYAGGNNNDYRFLYESGNYAETISAITPMLETKPDDHLLWYYVGRSHQHLLQYDEAITAFHNVLDIDSTYIPVYFQLGRIYTETGKFEKAVNLLTYVHSLDKENTSILYVLAGVYNRNEQYDEALGSLERGLKIDPEDRRFLRRYADLTFRINRFEDAARSYRRLIELGDSSMIVFRNCGISHYFLDDNYTALPYLTTAYRTDASDPNTVLYYGLVNRDIGNIGYSIGILDDAIHLLSRGILSDALMHLGKSYELIQNISDAVKKYRLVLELNKERPETYYYLASVFDGHYEDRTVPKAYYRTFLEHAGGKFPELEEHAQKRIETLREELFFNR